MSLRPENNSPLTYDIDFFITGQKNPQNSTGSLLVIGASQIKVFGEAPPKSKTVLKIYFCRFKFLFHLPVSIRQATSFLVDEKGRVTHETKTFPLLAPCSPRLYFNVICSVADLHHFNADPDPVPAFHFNADPDPVDAPHPFDSNL